MTGCEAATLQFPLCQRLTHVAVECDSDKQTNKCHANVVKVVGWIAPNAWYLLQQKEARQDAVQWVHGCDDTIGQTDARLA